MISTRKWLITLGSIAAGLLFFVTMVHAEQPYDITNCWSGESKVLFASKELVVMGYELKGIARDNLEAKSFDNMSFQCVGISKIVAGKTSGSSYCKFMDLDGDYTVGETTSSGAEGNWKFLHGTGKWNGVTGGGKMMYITKSKPIEEGTFQNCNRATGTYELPKQ